MCTYKQIKCTEDRRNTALCSLRHLSNEELNERENLIESDALANSVEEGEIGGADWYDFCPIWDASRLSANRFNKSLVENQCLKPTVRSKVSASQGSFISNSLYRM